MNIILESLKKYFQETPKEDIIKDAKSLNEWNNVGPTIDNFLKLQKDNVISKERNSREGIRNI